MWARVVLPSPGGPKIEHMIEALAAIAGRAHEDAEVGHEPRLADELVESTRSQRLLEAFLAGPSVGGEDLARHG